MKAMILPRGAMTPDESKKAKLLVDLIGRTNISKPKREDMQALNRFFDENPEFWRTVMGFAEATLMYLIQSIGSFAEGFCEARMRECAAMAEDLGYGDAPAIEQLLIKQVVICWLRLQYVEHFSTTSTIVSSCTFKEAEHWDRRLTSAQKRYTRAIESLARVRKITSATKPKSRTAAEMVRQVTGAAIRGLQRGREDAQLKRGYKIAGKLASGRMR